MNDSTVLDGHSIHHRIVTEVTGKMGLVVGGIVTNANDFKVLSLRHRQNSAFVRYMLSKSNTEAEACSPVQVKADGFNKSFFEHHSG